MKNKQTGLSLISMLIVAIILAFLFLLGMRTVPVVTEYMGVKRIIQQIVETESGPDVSVSQLRSSFDKRAYIDQIESVTGQDLVIYKRGDAVEISVAYSRKIPLAGNASLLLDFKTQASSGT